jgi:hypothetical protein
VVTGAGASRHLGTNGDLPLMDEWAQILREKCEHLEHGLPDALSLVAGISSQDFERIVGEVLALQADLSLIERYQSVGGPQAGTTSVDVVNWRNQLAQGSRCPPLSE